MRTANAALIAYLLSGRSCWQADLYDIVLYDGTQIHWTSFDKSLQVGTTLYSAVGPQISRDQWSIKNKIEIPEMDLNLSSTGTDYNGQNIKLLLHNGMLDGATITLSRVFMPSPGVTSLGTVVLFSGNAGTVKINALGGQVTVKGANYVLSQYMPKNLYLLNCLHNTYDTGCAPGLLNSPDYPGPTRAANTLSGVVESGSSPISILWDSSGTTTPGQFALGYIKMTSGVTEGQVKTVQTSSAGLMILAYPLYGTPAPGDTFDVTYGCNKSSGNCGFFNQYPAGGGVISGNLQHRRAFPFIPPAETAL